MTPKRTLALLLVLTPLLAASAARAERREEGTLVFDGVPEAPAELGERLRQYENVRAAALDGWDPVRGGLLVTTRFAETAQLHHVARPGAYRQQLTFFAEPIREAAMRPAVKGQKAHGLVLLKDVGGDENYQLHYLDLATGKAHLLTDGKARHGEARWSHAGDRVAYFGTGRNGKDWDIYVTTPEAKGAGEARRVYEGEGSWVPYAWSPDDRRLLVGKYVSINESSLHVLDLATGALTQVNPSEKRIAYGESAVFSGDGKGVFYTSDEAGEFRQLVYWDLTRRQATVLSAKIDWDVEELAISPDGRALAFTVNEDGILRLYLMNTKTRAHRQVKGLPIGLLRGLHFSPDGRQLGVGANTPQTPGDVFVVDVKNPKKVTRWTHSEVGGLDPEIFVVPELVRYPTFDQVEGKAREIPAFVYRPRGAKGAAPVIVYIHGGPESQFVPYFSSSLQYYLNELGVAVVAPNVRGSAGYGKSYLELDNGFKREDSVRDIGALLDWIEKDPGLDGKRVVVMGGSYGGYMVLATLAHYGDRLVAGVDNVGISNFVTFLTNTKDYRRDLRRQEYGDERDPEMRAFLEKISPTNNVEKITKPLFIGQGQNDPRVPVSEAEQMLAALRARGGTAWYLLARDEGHGFRKKKNYDAYRQAVVLFLQAYLLTD
ncbi:MAG: S9 family peptidase [Deltaproteobacteria bacterium]|nr:S9 family peptidase [Deltaproteobacteria bacterium]